MCELYENKATVPNKKIKFSSSALQQKPVAYGDGLIYSGRNENDCVVKAWGQYLDSREWQLWTTLTTGRELTLPGARRSINKLSEYLRTNGYPSEIFWCAEPFDLKEGFHLHSLIRFAGIECGEDNKAQYNCLVKGWRQITGDTTARIYSERYKKDRGANHYVGKYITKDRSDFDIIAPHVFSEDQREIKLSYNNTVKSEHAKRLEPKTKAQRKYFERKGISVSLETNWIAEQQKQSRLEQWRMAVGSDLQKKGIYAGRPAVEKPKYENTNLTFDHYESKIYKEEAIASTFVKIGSQRFTLVLSN